MTDFLLELRSEEIPARMQGKAKEDLARLFTDALTKAGLAAESAETFATPRRLALIATGLPLETEAVSEETKGPKVGAPPQAMEGFLRKTGLAQDQLVERDGVYFAVVEKAGRTTADVLAEAIPAIIRAFPWPKSQRWGAASISTESLRWVRPLQGIVALLGDAVVPCEIDGLASGRATMGHRFHHSGPVTIANATAYIETLRAAHVIVHFSERCRIIREGAAKAAADAGLVLVEDEGLVAENAGLTEWPVPMLGRFDPAFLSVPEEVIQLTARVNQKYFVCKNPPRNGEVARSDGGVGPGSAKSSTFPSASTGPSTASGSPPRSGEDFQLANAFVCTANIVAHDGGAAIVAGNEKVLAARLSDAKFFYEQDLKVPLAVQCEKLSSIVFHEKLGTVADKVERVAKLARWLVESGVVKSSPERGGGAERRRGPKSGTSELLEVGTPPSASPPPPRSGEDLATLAERAARLCKADLVTGMVGEFPELQGIMGGYYARAQGEDDAVADAVRDHYKPVGQGDEVPTAPVTVAVSLADKLDTIATFFRIEEIPTGSKDPFAIRRATLGAIRLILQKQLRLNLPLVIEEAMSGLERQRKLEALGRGFGDGTGYGGGRRDYPLFILDFFVERLKVQQREAGFRHDLIFAVFGDLAHYVLSNQSEKIETDLVRLLARVKALQAFVGTDEGANLLAGYKRAANILKAAPVAPAEAGASAGVGSQGVPQAPAFAGATGVEITLHTALDTAEPLAAAAIEAEDFEAAMTALASLRAPIDAFFEGVMVNDPDPDKRAYRLGLLTRFRDAVHRVADFSRIEG